MRLIQEEYRGDTWGVLASCVLLNRARGEKAVPIIRAFLAKYPLPQRFITAKGSEVISMLTPLGLQFIRRRRLLSLAHALLDKVPPTRIGGIGKYGVDSYLIFVEGRDDVNPNDKKLRAYLAQKKKWSDDVS